MDKNWISKISENEKSIYSQNGQDGVIEYIFSNLQTKNKCPFGIEFGFNSNKLEGGSGSNMANLVINYKWEKLLLDNEYENHSINLHKYYLTSDNICSIFSKHKVPKSPEYISIDVDSVDLWLFKAILSEYFPMVVSVEYNAHFPIDRAITFVNGLKDIEILLKSASNIKNIKKRRNVMRGLKVRTYGASLKGLKMVGDEFGYSLVYVIKGADAYFIKNDLIINCDIPTLDSFEDKTFFNKHKRQKNKNAVNYFLDYETYVDTNGNIKKSIKHARNICKECILKTIKV